MDRTIQMQVNGEFVRKDGKNAGVQGEANVTKLSIQFSEEWGSFSKRIVWRDAFSLLNNYIERQKERGVANIKSFEIEYHKRFAMTAAAFILTIIGMTLSARKVKGGMGINIGIGLVLSFSYILFMTVTSSFAVSGLTSPMLAMWIPNIVYAVIAFVLYKKASKG